MDLSRDRRRYEHPAPVDPDSVLDLPEEIAVDEMFVRQYPWAGDRDTVRVSKGIVAGHVFVCLGNNGTAPSEGNSHFVRVGDLRALVGRKVLRITTRFPAREDLAVVVREDDIEENPPISIGLLHVLERVYNREDMMEEDRVVPLSLDSREYDPVRLKAVSETVRRERRAARDEGLESYTHAQGSRLAFDGE